MELVYPSIGQVADQAEKVSSYLELYRAGSSSADDSVGLGQTKLQRSGSKRSLRRSRSLGDFYSVADIREMRSHRAGVAARGVTSEVLVQSPTSLMSPKADARSPQDDDVAIKRKRSLANAKAAIIGTDAKLMAQFRVGFGTSVPPMPRARPTTPLPTSPLPSALLAVKSPRAPYWIRPTDPKTPRTLRTERRMGWGGAWNVGSMGVMVNQLREL